MEQTQQFAIVGILICLGLLAILSAISVYNYRKNNPVYQLLKEVKKEYLNKGRLNIKNVTSRFSFSGKYAYNIVLSNGKKIFLDVYYPDAAIRLYRHIHGGDPNSNDYEVMVGEKYEMLGGEKLTKKREYNYTAEKLYKYVKQIHEWQK